MVDSLAQSAPVDVLVSGEAHLKRIGRGCVVFFAALFRLLFTRLLSDRPADLTNQSLTIIRMEGERNGRRNGGVVAFEQLKSGAARRSCTNCGGPARALFRASALLLVVSRAPSLGPRSSSTITQSRIARLGQSRCRLSTNVRPAQIRSPGESIATDKSNSLATGKAKQLLLL